MSMSVLHRFIQAMLTRDWSTVDTLAKSSTDDDFSLFCLPYRPNAPLYLIEFMIERRLKLHLPTLHAVSKVAFFGNAELLDWLLNVKNFDPNEPNNEGELPITVTHPHGIPVLLKTNKVDVNARNKDGETVLMRTVRYHGVHESIALLLAYGANPCLVNRHGRNVIHSARVSYEYLVRRAVYIPILLSPILVPRLGARSALRLLNTDLVRLLLRYIFSACECHKHRW